MQKRGALILNKILSVQADLAEKSTKLPAMV